MNWCGQEKSLAQVAAHRLRAAAGNFWTPKLSTLLSHLRFIVGKP